MFNSPTPPPQSSVLIYSHLFRAKNCTICTVRHILTEVNVLPVVAEIGLNCMLFKTVM